MITVCLNGRLGNQLFQYALAIELSKRYNTFYVIDDSQCADAVRKYFEPISIVNNKYVRRVLRAYYTSAKLGKVVQTGFEAFEAANQEITNNKYFDGYYQSAQFFPHIAGRVRELFKVKANYHQQFIARYGQLFQGQKVLVIHCRIGDYLTWGNEALGGTNLVLPIAYYKQALAAISNLADYKVILVTDDKIAAEKAFDFLPEKQIISDQEIIDFQLLMFADKLIISNSTFAWWAAMLNVKGAQVFAPQYWLGFKVGKEYPPRIIPAQFTAISFV